MAAANCFLFSASDKTETGLPQNGRLPRFLTMVLSLLFVVWLCFLQNVLTSQVVRDRAYQPGDVVLGSLLALHRGGGGGECKDIYLPGLSRLQATVFTIEQINKDQELLPNIRLGYDIRNYCGDRALAMANTYDFVTNINLIDYEGCEQLYNMSNVCRRCMKTSRNASAPVVAIVGPYGSRNSLQVAGLLQVVNMASISPSATSEELSWPFYNKFFRTVPPDGYQAKAMADLIEHFNWTYVAAIATEHSYGLYGIRALERESLERQTFCIAFAEYLPPSRYSNQLGPVIAKLKRNQNIKVVLLWIGDTIATDLIQEARSQNVRGRVWLMSDSLATKTPEFLGTDAEFFGVYIGIEPRRYHDYGFERHLQTLTPRKSLEIGNDWWDRFWINEFNCSAKQDSKRAETCPDNLTITGNLFEKMHDGFIPYHIDAIYAIAHALHRIYKCEKYGGLLYTGQCPQTTPFVKSEDVLTYLRNVSFEGLTGQVEFDEHGDPKGASYDIIAFQRGKDPDHRYTKVKLGAWDPVRRIQVNDSEIRWNSAATQHAFDPSAVPISVCRDKCLPGKRQTVTMACCWECLDCPDGTMSSYPGATNCSECSKTQKSNENKTACVDLPVIALKWSDATTVVLVTMTACGLAVTVFVALVFVIYRKTPLVKSSNRELSFFLLLEIFAGFILPLIIIPHKTDATCFIAEPWRYITSTTAVSILLLKTMRLLRAFQITAMAQWIKNFSTNNNKQLAAVCVINAVEFLFVVLWYIFDPPHVNMEVKKNEYVLVTCKTQNIVSGKVLQGLILIYFILLSVLCTFYAFKARNLPENFSEARYIGFSMYILLLSWITYLPVQYSLEGWYVVVVSCATVLVSSYGLLICMFAPKVYVILRHPEQNTATFVRAELRTINKVAPLTKESP